ncbi:MAG TPA: 30S ribosomal protein S2 [Candidatus Limnocylindrales bacterium]|nr:30S ribosomal protein S2 [Candidatus Limnocylindrales bacterium]
MLSNVSMKQLLETGVHFGHRTTKWNPKMKPYIYMERNGIHIIDLQQTLANLNQYADMITDIVKKGGSVLFVGTKRQAQEAIAHEAERASMPYVNTRWLGGTLTNWTTIRKRIDTLKSMEKKREAGEFEILNKKERLQIDTEIEKLQLRLGGIRDMKRLPELLIIVDTVREATAVKEANSLKIPVLALADTNSNPDQIDYILPANDDAVRAIKLLLAAFADAAIEGQQSRKDVEEAGVEPEYVDKDQEEDDEKLLGESILSKLRSTKLADEDETDEEEEA